MKDRWQFDESIHVGVDYSKTEVVSNYDAIHGRFRNYDEEAERIIQALSIEPEHVVLDMGCGTGAFALRVARQCKKVFAVDISRAMLDCLTKKARETGVDNIETHLAGFLSYSHSDKPVDAIVSVVALHHLPDFWKQIALKKMYDILKPGGRLFISDVVFSFPISDYSESLNDWLDMIEEKAGADMKEEAIVHIKDEFSTWNWIMEGILERAGFNIDSIISDNNNGQAYVCTKIIV
ncbi:MAG: class I SAM-dependent methyltransferase [Euryarchaeota archaeon]|nr:class I SAM-dependent methyltransferase [Euryarchaeota archaeon]